jgi:anti-sigma-K factor RskA
MTDPQRHQELRELIAAYVLGAVTPEEQASIRSHLLSCEECMGEADRHAAAASSLALAAGPEPLPDGFADRVMARVAAERPGEAAARSRPRRRSPLAWPAVAALSLLVAVLGVGLVREQQEQAREREIVQALLRDDGMSLGGAGGAIGRMVPKGGGGLFVASGLREAPEGHSYQLWLIEESCPGGCDPVSAGTFGVSGSLAVLETPHSPGRFDAAAVTIEPEGGSEAPTSEPVIASA